MAKVKKMRRTGCWVWTGGLTYDWRGGNRAGYGRFSIGGKPKLAHRVAYELFRGPIPDGMVLDHTCERKSCVNPDHLEPVSSRENVLRHFAGGDRDLLTEYLARWRSPPAHRPEHRRDRERSGRPRDCEPRHQGG